MEDMDTSMEEFFGAFEGADGNQTDTNEEDTGSESTEDTEEEEPTQEPQEDADSGDSPEGEVSQESEETPAEASDEAGNGNTEQKFVVKVNSEMREVSYEDAPAWIQKGMDYDRVKGQLETERQTSQDLQSKLDQQQEYLDTLDIVAKAANIPVTELLERLHVNAVKKEGQTEAEVRAQLRAEKLEKQLNTQKAQADKAAPEAKQPEEDPAEARMQRELQEFKKTFPDVKIDEKLAEKLGPEIRNGLSLTSAYLKLENARLKAEAEQQRQKEAAAAKNRENRAKAPGSQRDSGGQRTKTATDDFFAAFEK